MYEHERLSSERLFLLEQSWMRLLGGFGVEPAAAYPVYDRLIEAYSEPQRHYHTLEHIAETLKIAGRLGASPTVQLAIWFHDAFYDPKARDNEERSAAMASERLRPLGIDTTEVERLILVTTHTADPKNASEAILLDSDLAILGSEEKRYWRYAEAIRKEYAHVSDADYRKGRVRILQSFLARPAIYHTAIMKAEGEVPARLNLQGEIEALRGV